MEMLAEYIEQLKESIAVQTELLDHHIENKQYRYAGNQEDYIDGLRSALSWAERMLKKKSKDYHCTNCGCEMQEGNSICNTCRDIALPTDVRKGKNKLYKEN